MCAATCALPNNSSSPDAVSETYQTSNCQVTCTFLPAFLYGSARIERSPYFVGVDYGARHLSEVRARVAAARREMERARAASDEAFRRAQAHRLRDAQTVAQLATLEARVAEAEKLVEVAEYIVAKARKTLEEAPSHRVRSSAGALEEALANAEQAREARDVALADVAHYHASAPLPPVTEATAPFAEAAALSLEAEAAERSYNDTVPLVGSSGLRALPLPPELASDWQRDDGWGGSSVARPAGALLKLTEATGGHKGGRLRGQAGWFVLRPGRALNSFRVELDLLIGGGDGGGGFALSYAPIDKASMLAAVEEAELGGGGGEGAQARAQAAKAQAEAEAASTEAAQRQFAYELAEFVQTGRVADSWRQDDRVDRGVGLCRHHHHRDRDRDRDRDRNRYRYRHRYHR